MSDVQKTMEDHIKMSLLAALNQDSERLIKGIVDQVLNERAAYSSGTFLQSTLNSMIKDSVREIILGVVEEQKDTITAAIRARLTDKFFEKFRQQIAVGVENHLEIKFNVKESDLNY